MTRKGFGPRFCEELREAGLLGLPFSWTYDGEIMGQEALTAQQRAKLDAVVVAHDPRCLPLASLKAEAGQFITTVVSATAQLNLNAAMNVIGAKAISSRTAEEAAFATTFAEGHAWIQAVRARVHVLDANGGTTPGGEERWPQPTQAVRYLATHY